MGQSHRFEAKKELPIVPPLKVEMKKNAFTNEQSVMTEHKVEDSSMRSRIILQKKCYPSGNASQTNLLQSTIGKDSITYSRRNPQSPQSLFHKEQRSTSELTPNQSDDTPIMNLRFQSSFGNRNLVVVSTKKSRESLKTAKQQDSEATLSKRSAEIEI